MVGVVPDNKEKLSDYPLRWLRSELHFLKINPLVLQKIKEPLDRQTNPTRPVVENLQDLATAARS